MRLPVVVTAVVAIGLGWVATANAGPQTNAEHVTVHVAKSRGEAVRNCGAPPKARGPWRCEGHGPKGSEDARIKFTYQKIVWTWVQGGKTANDDWTTN